MQPPKVPPQRIVLWMSSGQRWSAASTKLQPMLCTMTCGGSPCSSFTFLKCASSRSVVSQQSRRQSKVKYDSRRGSTLRKKSSASPM